MTRRVTVTTADEQQLTAYVAPGAPEPGSAGVVVIHEINGLTVHFASLCERLAQHGYSAIAPDLFSRDPRIVDDAKAGDYPSALSRIYQLGPERLVADLSSARNALVSGYGVAPERVAVLGFCFGGYLTLLAATDPNGGWAAAAPFYGPPAGYGALGAPTDPNPLARADKLSCPARLFYGRQDGLIPAADALEFVTKAQAAGGNAELILEDAGHAFFNDTRDTYHEAAAVHAWKELLVFLDSTLKDEK